MNYTSNYRCDINETLKCMTAWKWFVAFGAYIVYLIELYHQHFSPLVCTVRTCECWIVETKRMKTDFPVCCAWKGEPCGARLNGSLHSQFRAWRYRGDGWIRVYSTIDSLVYAVYEVRSESDHSPGLCIPHRQTQSFAMLIHEDMTNGVLIHSVHHFFVNSINMQKHAHSLHTLINIGPILKTLCFKVEWFDICHHTKIPIATTTINITMPKSSKI